MLAAVNIYDEASHPWLEDMQDIEEWDAGWPRQAPNLKTELAEQH